MKTRNRVQSKTANKETKLFNCRNQIPRVLIARLLLQMSVTQSNTNLCFQEPRARPLDPALAASMRTCSPPGERTWSSRWWRGRARGCSPGAKRGREPWPQAPQALRGQRPRPLTAPRPALRGLAASERGWSPGEAHPVTPRQRGSVPGPGARPVGQEASQETRGCRPLPPPCLLHSQGARGWCRPGASQTLSTPALAPGPGRSPSRRCSPRGYPRVTRWRRDSTTC